MAIVFKMIGFIIITINLIKEAYSNDSLNLTNYYYPKPHDIGDGLYRIALFGTNDLHGSAYPLNITHPVTGENYSYGGLEYMAQYIKILRDEWQDRFLWLDAGDQFQGGIESRVSNGSIMTEFFNLMNITDSAIGNHEFDYGQKYLYDRIQSANWTYLAANMVNSSYQPEFWPNVKVSRLINVGRVKIGIIGLTTIETPFTTSGNLTNIQFLKYQQIITILSKKLRLDGANAVSKLFFNLIVLTSHVGLNCPNEAQKRMKLTVRSKWTKQAQCNSEDEMSILLNSLEDGIIDAVVAGHVHDTAHVWINNIPVIQNPNGGYYSNVMYLTFDNTTLKFRREAVQIEGPLPTCQKVFSNSKNCKYVTKSDSIYAGEFKNYTFHNVPMQSNPIIQNAFAKYWDSVLPYKIIVGSTEETLVRNNGIENILGSFTSDCIKNATNASIAFLNDGALRSTWFPGNILVEHVWNMFPFENTVQTVEMNGADLKKMFVILQKGKKGFYHSSGVSQNATLSPHALLNIKLSNGTEIDDNGIFTVVSNDFMFGGGDDFKEVKSWYTPINLKTYGNLRNTIIECITQVKTIKRSDYYDINNRRLNFVNSTQAFLKFVSDE